MRLFTRLASFAATSLFLARQVDASSLSRSPLNYVSRIENPRIQTPSHRVHAFSTFDLTFDLHQTSQRLKLSLEPNYDLLSDDTHVEYLDKDGAVRHTERIVREEHKVFQGKTWVLEHDRHWRSVGWSRIVIQRDGLEPLFEGAFSLWGDHHHIQLRSTYVKTKHPMDPVLDDSGTEYMACYRDSDFSQELQTQSKRAMSDRSCGAHELPFNADPNHPILQAPIPKRERGLWGAMSLNPRLGKRQSIDSFIPGGGGNSAVTNLEETIGDNNGCPSTRKVALVGVATDCSYTASFDSEEDVKKNVIKQFNTASELYQSTFNITLGVQKLTVSKAECPGTPLESAPWNMGCPGSVTIEERLNLFSAWRGERGDDYAFWTLLAGPECNNGAKVGLAWLGQLCVSQVRPQSESSGANQTVTGANVVVKTNQEWQVIAHEIGHTFGAVHDCDESACADDRLVSAQQCCPSSKTSCGARRGFIMNPSSSEGVGEFSPCTVGNVCSALGLNSVESACLSDNRGVQTITGSQCGNGIVEDGEDCDCGGSESCADNNCCDAETCRFQSGAVCDDSNEGCCESCQFSAAGSVCRSSAGTCDPEETCSGNDGECPADKTSDDGSSCGDDGDDLQCASGQCTSRDQQCKTLMAAYSTNNDTYACNSQTCTVSCASPEFGANVCYSMQQNFLDGTPCSGGGNCQNGICEGGSVGGEISSWIEDNKTVVIAVSATVGGLLLLGILGCLWRCCSGRKKQSHKGRHTLPSDMPRDSGPYQSQMDYQGGYPRSQSWNMGPRSNSVRYA